MKTRIAGYTIVLGLMLGFGTQITYGKMPPVVPIKDLPASTLAAANKASPNTTWRLCILARDDWYILFGKDSTNHSVEFRLDPTGRNSYFRTTIQRGEVPAAAISAISARFSNFEIKRIQACGFTEGRVVAYRLEGSGLPEKHNCVYSNARGSKVFSANDF